MINGIFDSHAHYDDGRFDSDRHELLMSLTEKGVSHVVNCAVNLKSSYVCIELAEKYPHVFAAVGVHPHEAVEVAAGDLERITELLSHRKVVAVGEIGLDYHYDFSPRDIQLEIFERQLIIAKELDLPVIVHDRESHEDTMTLLTKYRPKGIVHCFSGSAEMAKQVVALGMYIGLGGAVTFKNARKPLEVAAVVPDNRLLLETDCPYMTPVPFRGERNDSSFIPYTAEVIASVRGTDAQTLVELTARNACSLFNIE